MSWNYKFISRLPQGFNDDDVLFLKQLGIEEAYIALPLGDHNIKAIRGYKERVENAGLKMHNIHSNLYTFNHDIFLGTDKKDEAIDGFIEYIEMLSEVGITNADQTCVPFFVYSSGTVSQTRFCDTRSMDLDIILNSDHPWGKSAWVNPDNETRLSQLSKYFLAAKEQPYTRQQLWDNFAYFMDRIRPTLEKTGFILNLHPNDPPCFETVGGVPQLIRTMDDYRQAIRLAGTDRLKISFCCGCWLEGGDKVGNLLRDLEWALQNDLVSMVHLRNITAPLPKFDETFLDNGYFDIYEIFRILRKYNYEGFINPDHHPTMVDGPLRRAPQAYAFGYMRGLAGCADREFNLE